MIYKGIVSAIVLAAALFGASADAQLVQPMNSDFENCDGFGAVTTVGDGMSEAATGIWVAGGDRVRRTPTFRGGVESCTRALQAMDEFPQFWLRRVSLLQARAIHRLIRNDPSGALADLDLADDAATDAQDPYYLRSIALNTNLVRALALVQNGERESSETLAMETWTRRPHSREVIGAAMAIVGADGAVENVDRLLLAASQMDPSNSEFAYSYMFETGRFEAALAVYGEILPPRAIHDQTFDLRTNIQNAEQERARTELFWLDVAGRKAYALAALGRYNEARTTLAAARTRIEGATPPPTPLSPRPSNRNRIQFVAQEQANLEIQTRAPEIRDVWAGLVEARAAAGEGRVEEARAAFDAMTKLPPSYAVIDLARALQIDPTTLEAMERTLPTARLGLPQRDARALFSLLLDAETRSRTDARMHGFDAAFTSRNYRERGGCREEEPSERTAIVCYKGLEATLAVTEERALLRAAARAAENGGRFRIERREDIRHSVVATMYGTPMSESQAGFESRLFIRYVDSGEACTRCLTASEVQESLSSVYAQAAQRERQ